MMFLFYLKYITDDRSRVVLQLVDNDPDSDYVNASFIDVSRCFLKGFMLMLSNVQPQLLSRLGAILMRPSRSGRARRLMLIQKRVVDDW